MNGAKAGLGVAVSSRGLEAALDLPNAEGVSLCLYDGDREVFRAAMPRDAGGVFRGLAPDFGAGARYGFRVDGPFDPGRGARFDASKLLADPYAWAFDRPFRLHPSMFAFGDDSGPDAPKAIAGAPTAGEPGRKRVPADSLVIYELNLRGFSRLNPAIPESARGTFAGLADPASIAHLAALGVTAVEIMPSDAFVDERHLPPLGLSNAWGYNSVVFGVPDPRLAPGGWAEVRATTDALHAAGMEAILDVVFNHSGESDQFGPTLSFRGLDNATWFRLDPHNPPLYVNDAGTGNCLALDRPLVVDMAIGALKRWMLYGGIDGFRFDLATTLGRGPDGFNPNAPFFRALAEDPILQRARLIAEPWDVGWGGYQLGAFGPDFAEWNDHFRDAARRFWRGDPGLRGEVATRMAGSRDIFPRAQAPSKGVNFVVAHDGFTLADLVAYEHKHNEANGEFNRDGTDANFSWNHGVEGPTEDPAILAARARDQRNLLTLLLASRGTPMLAMGSELGFSQGGNNNAYAQDNATTAIDWNAADRSMIAFVSRLVAIRHARPALSRDAFLTGAPFDSSGLPDVEWRDAAGPLTPEAWNDPPGAILVAIFAAPHGEGIDRVAVAMNRGHEDVELTLPEPRAGMGWRVLAETDRPDATERPVVLADRRRLSARACVVLGESANADFGLKGRPPSAAVVDALAGAAGIAAEWWDVSGNRTIVSPETKIALLTALGLGAGSDAQAHESLARVVDETRRRRVPPSLVVRFDEPLVAPLRDAPQACEARIDCEDGSVREWRVEAGDGAPKDATRRARRRRAVDRAPRSADRPSSPHRRRRRLHSDSCAARGLWPQGGAAQALRRCGADLRHAPRRRSGRRRFFDDWRARARRPAARGRPISASARCTCCSRGIASARAPITPRTADSSIRSLSTSSNSGLGLDAELAALGPALASASATKYVDYPAVWTMKRAALEALHAAFARIRAARRMDPLVMEFDAFVSAGGDALRRFAAFQAIAAGDRGENWRSWPAALRDGDAGAIETAIASDAEAFDFALFCQWLADRQLGRAATRARASWTRNRLLSRSRGWRCARRLGSLGARARTRAGRHDRRAARSILGPGPELGPAGAQSARRRAPGLGAVRHGRRRQHAPRRYAAHRSRNGLSTALSHSRRGEAGGRRLSRLPARRYHRPLRARESARPMHGRRRGSRHGGGRLPRPADAGQYPGHAGAVVRARGRRGASCPPTIRRSRSPASPLTIWRRSPAGGRARTSRSECRWAF